VMLHKLVRTECALCDTAFNTVTVRCKFQRFGYMCITICSE